jgi:hypothetical protein
MCSIIADSIDSKKSRSAKERNAVGRDHLAPQSLCLLSLVIVKVK